jgi:threonine synthase
LKYEGTNFPTGSFKDRLVAVALARARRLGLETIACSSTGNLAIALGAAAARQGLRAVVFVPDDLDPSTLAAAAAFGPVLLGVRGGYDRANRLTAQLADRYPWAFLNVNLRAYYAEGAKTIGFEIAEQRGFRLPGHVVLPMASGSLLVKVEQAFRELVEVRLVPDEPCAVYGVQPSGCGPIVTAFERGTSLIDPVKPATLVKSLSLGDPADGPAAVAAIRRAKGRASAATDDESFEGLKLLARTEGLLAEPAGGTVVAAARRLAEGAFRDGRSVVLVIPARPSGSPGHEPASGFTSVIEPTLDAFDTFWRQLSVERGG